MPPHFSAWWWKQIQFPKRRKSTRWPWKRLCPGIWCLVFVEAMYLSTLRSNLLSLKRLYTCTRIHGFIFQKCNVELLLLTPEHCNITEDQRYGYISLELLLFCSLFFFSKVTERIHKGDSQNHKWKGHLLYGLRQTTVHVTRLKHLQSELTHKRAVFRRVRKIAW